MKFMTKCAVLLAPVLALATPAFASPPASLNDSEQPGSAIIFPKFINMPRVLVDGPPGIAVARTEIELGAVCPSGQVCPEGTKVKIRAHWVCPGKEGVDSNICIEEDFVITTLTVNGKVVFAPDGIAINSNSPRVPPAPCARGYLIAWVIRATDDAPIKFDALIGNAVIRGPALSSGFSTSVSAYNAIPIQANTIDAVNAPLGTPLDFDGASGGYQQLTDVQTGDVRFDKTAAQPGGPDPQVFSQTFLIFLTLDVASGLPNNPTFVPLVFYNENEVPTSISFYEFTCWDQVSLFDLAHGTTALTQNFQTTRKGIVIAGPAHKVDIGSGDPGGSGNATLIGVVETNEGTAAEMYMERKYDFNMVSPFLNGGNIEGIPVPGTIVTTLFFP
jgi:hypothetical protein